MAKPGRFPGEAAISKSEYSRWLDGISEMNANVIRTYTLHPPVFYEALAEHNESNEDPLFLLHGNWITEATLHEKRDAFDSAIIDDHREGIQHIIDAVHGNLSLPAEAGHASGEYQADVSPYVLGYIIGIEWDPEVVYDTDETHGDDLGEYDGTFIQTEDATPFEHWLAARMDDTATYEYEEYGDLRPLSFTNWPTTDHLDQPAEPSETEDLSSITLNHIYPTDEFDRGLFATYHVYPYYPDFLNHEPEYVNYVTDAGEESSYRGYLEDLVGANDYPVLIGEFGIPSSRGRTHTHTSTGFTKGGTTNARRVRWLSNSTNRSSTQRRLAASSSRGRMSGSSALGTQWTTWTRIVVHSGLTYKPTSRCLAS
ncbi:hypothetical protein [Natronolimnobius sp. AArcel1]|uniref:hypothetical protein n=1 Tax=Natronolimnobius sp. AArcel1 TaxID=1679093 RepID=UPI0013EBEC70|nr:hypothetical protein [Natronolimnobius sp. AArcel1]